jgi:hypothetical protein
MSAASRIPANFTGKGMMNNRCLKASQLDSFFLEVLGVEAELQSSTVKLRVISSDGGGVRPELGFAVAPERRGQGRTVRLGFPPGGADDAL